MSSIGDNIVRRAERIYREVKPFALYGIILLVGYFLYPIVWPYLKRPEVLAILPDGDVRLNVDFSYGPIYGRCYGVFHNQVKLGRLEIRPHHSYDAAAPELITEIELDMVRLLSYDRIEGFLSTIASYVCERNPGDGKYTNPNQAIVGTLAKALWETQEITEFADLDGQGWGELHCTFVGLATRWYFDRREALRKNPALRSESGRREEKEKREELAANIARDVARMLKDPE